VSTEIDLLTLDEAAARLKVTRQWLKSAIYNGWGPPFIALGKQGPHFRPGDLARWLDSRTHSPKLRPPRARTRFKESDDGHQAR